MLLEDKSLLRKRELLEGIVLKQFIDSKVKNTLSGSKGPQNILKALPALVKKYSVR